MTSELRLHAMAAFLAMTIGCADFHRGDVSADAGTPPTDGGATGDGGSTRSFATSVHPLLTDGCQTCHRAGGAAGSTGFLLTGDAEADYAEAVALTDASHPSASRLLRKASGAGHGGGAVYGESTPEYQSLLAWIAGGAQP